MAEITEVVVHAGRTFNHPHEQFSNLRPSVQIKATLAEGEDAKEATKKLQAMAEELVEDHKQNMLKSLDDLFYMEQEERECQSLERTLKLTQERLAAIRSHNDNSKASLPSGGDDLPS